MSSISVRLPDALLHETDALAEGLHLTRAVYLREALERMNASVRAEIQRKRLIEASLRVRGESAKVNEEFAEIDDVAGA